jgi:hypothetical protein
MERNDTRRARDRDEEPRGRAARMADDIPYAGREDEPAEQVAAQRPDQFSSERERRTSLQPVDLPAGSTDASSLIPPDEERSARWSTTGPDDDYDDPKNYREVSQRDRNRMTTTGERLGADHPAYGAQRDPAQPGIGPLPPFIALLLVLLVAVTILVIVLAVA